MAEFRKVEPVKLIFAVTFAQGVDLNTVEERLIYLYGQVDDRSIEFDFSYTDYYEREMGKHLRKLFISFENLINPGELAQIKTETNVIEKEFAEKNRRRVNLDPAYLSGSKLVVASAKNFAHRVYIGKGVYGDLQLQYRHNDFRPHPWTFPDYKSDSVIDFLKRVREKYLSGDRYDKKD